MTEIKLSINVYVSGNLVSVSTLSTFDLSAPARIIDRLAEKYGHCTIVVTDSTGKRWRKEFGE